MKSTRKGKRQRRLEQELQDRIEALQQEETADLADLKPEELEYEPVNIHELVDRCLEYDMQSFDELIRELRPMVYKMYQSYLSEIPHFSLEDWLAECDSSLWECVFRYRPKSGVIFPSFFKQVIYYASVTHNRTYGRRRDVMMTAPLSLDLTFADGHTVFTAYQLSFHAMEDRDLCQDDTSTKALTRCEFDLVMACLKKRLNERDRNIISLVYAGYTRAEISRMLKVPESTITSVLRRCQRIVSVDRLMRDC